MGVEFQREFATVSVWTSPEIVSTTTRAQKNKCGKSRSHRRRLDADGEIQRPKLIFCFLFPFFQSLARQEAVDSLRCFPCLCFARPEPIGQRATEAERSRGPNIAIGVKNPSRDRAEYSSDHELVSTPTTRVEHAHTQHIDSATA